MVNVAIEFKAGISRSSCIFWNNVINFKDVVGIVGSSYTITVQLEVDAKDADIIPLRIKQIKAFALDMGIQEYPGK